MTSLFLAAGETPKIVLVGGPNPLWPQIIREYERRYPTQRATWEVGAKSDTDPADLMMAYYPTREELRAPLTVSATRKLGFPTEFVAAAWKQPVDPKPSAQASRYLDEGGVEDGVRLLAYLFSLVRPTSAPIEPPLKRPQVGINHPDAGEVFSEYDAYLDWWQHTKSSAHSSGESGLPVVAVSFFGTWFRGRDLAVVNTLIRRLETQGYLPLPMFGYPLDAVAPLLRSDGVQQPAIVIALNAAVSAPKDAATYESWGVPVLNGLVFTISGNYRDGFPDKVQLLDRAVRLAAQADDGLVAAHDRDLEAALAREGVEPAEAARQNQIRIFSAKSGAYGVGVQYLVEKSGGGDSADRIAALYASNMGFGYSADRWGVAAGASLRANLRSIDAVQFSRWTNLYGSLDNDDTDQYVGGLRTAIEQTARRAPEVYLHNLRRAGDEKMTSLGEWLAVELHSRQLNPKWIEEMTRSGYAGAREISQEIEHLYGFQKTAPDHLNPRTWQTVLDVFVKDKYRLGLGRFFQEQNPHARQTVLARLLEIDRQRTQRFSAEDRTILLVEYAQSVARDGAACSAQSLRQRSASAARGERASPAGHRPTSDEHGDRFQSSVAETLGEGCEYESAAATHAGRRTPDTRTARHHVDQPLASLVERQLGAVVGVGGMRSRLRGRGLRADHAGVAA